MVKKIKPFYEGTPRKEAEEIKDDLDCFFENLRYLDCDGTDMKFHFFMNKDEWDSFGGDGNTKFLFSGTKKKDSHKGEICIIFAGLGGSAKYKSLESDGNWVII